MDLVLPDIGLIARFLLGLDMLALITLLGGADREARSGGMVGQNGTAITPTDKNRIAVFRCEDRSFWSTPRTEWLYSGGSNSEFKS